MYSIFVCDYTTKAEGWLRDIEVNKAKDNYSGEQRVTPVLDKTMNSDTKVYNTLKDAIKAATQLKVMLSTIDCNYEAWQNQEIDHGHIYQYRMNYIIKVFDNDTHKLMYTIDKIAYDDNHMKPQYKRAIHFEKAWKKEAKAC